MTTAFRVLGGYLAQENGQVNLVRSNERPPMTLRTIDESIEPKSEEELDSSVFKTPSGRRGIQITRIPFVLEREANDSDDSDSDEIEQLQKELEEDHPRDCLEIKLYRAIYSGDQFFERRIKFSTEYERVYVNEEFFEDDYEEERLDHLLYTIDQENVRIPELTTFWQALQDFLEKVKEEREQFETDLKEKNESEEEQESDTETEESEPDSEEIDRVIEAEEREMTTHWLQGFIDRGEQIVFGFRHNSVRISQTLPPQAQINLYLELQWNDELAHEMHEAQMAEWRANATMEELDDLRLSEIQTEHFPGLRDQISMRNSPVKC